MGTLIKQARRDLNPQPPDLESGALAVRATGPQHSPQAAILIVYSTRGHAPSALTCFTVKRVLSTKAAVFLALEPIGSCAFVLHGRIITLSTGVAC
jgi:hypothetical protein